MQEEKPHSWRYFVTYSGVKLPLKMASELQENETANRNTYFRAAYDEQGQMTLCQKLVYGALEMEHRYRYYPNGALEEAEITMAGETRQIRFADSGELLD